MEQEVLAILSQVIHPAKDADILNLGMVEDVRVEEGKIKFRLVSSSPDPLMGSIKKQCEALLKETFPDYKVSIIELVREKKTKRPLELGQEQLANVGKIIAIASGKGGVGKSTVSTNLAIALAKAGYKVGLTDADVYGPSIPKMTGTEGMIPEAEQTENGGELILPIEKFGVKWMSIGYFATPEQALIWRGPMACNALKQMVLQVKWGELDYLLIDLPPGTGDIHISMVHDIPLSGAVIVSTPQAVALADVLKGVNMFRNKDINVPILGLVENMAWFTPAELPENKYYIFGKEGGVKMASQLGIDLLAQIPIYMSIRENGDLGTPDTIAEWANLAEEVVKRS
ncbi:MAG: Mrp/NBP35 family ATP-binding protein [Bacteroidales bacterium]|nr:Mrp/NBP35 family ATP-binding protein [Bacteroidales bacterium]MBQ2243221.1 Mrp/NBP35 family ATP-binding protein [Bacteroidales bacterium]